MRIFLVICICKKKLSSIQQTMTDFINVNVPIANGVTTPYGGIVYPWMRISAGSTSDFTEVRMRGPIYDKNGVEILGGGGGGGLATITNVGGGAGTIFKDIAPAGNANLKTILGGTDINITNNTDEILITYTGGGGGGIVGAFTDVWWQPTGTNPTSLVNKVIGDAAALNLYLNANTQTKRILVDTSIQNPAIVNVPLNCFNRVSIEALDELAVPLPDLHYAISCTASGTIVDCPYFRNIEIRTAGSVPALSYNFGSISPAAQFITFENSSVTGNQTDAQHWMDVLFANPGQVVMYLKNTVFGLKDAPNAAVISSGTGTLQFALVDNVSSLPAGVDYISSLTTTIDISAAPSEADVSAYNQSRSGLIAGYNYRPCDLKSTTTSDNLPQPINAVTVPASLIPLASDVITSIKSQLCKTILFVSENNNSTADLLFPVGATTTLAVVPSTAPAPVRNHYIWGSNDYNPEIVPGGLVFEFINNSSTKTFDFVEVNIDLSMIIRTITGTASTLTFEFYVNGVAQTGKSSLTFSATSDPAGTGKNISLKSICRNWAPAQVGELKITGTVPALSSLVIYCDEFQIQVSPLPFNGTFV
jgi:hypothetical protein